ncbi:uncharacterized protein BO96DRAFT_501832 [Aspergillus niger CBS 101883]|uniref:uncharacterized protein n=1 Tax=Aspergillus lacticoffeatus (strain CBS 101883) TaxID=1450533 RepID=UPI000D7EFD0C|nr:uncharacterized protein BO96DRAFT_501832 [Aspergillus niger CBS 101883]PYH54613.1 hypothetical protein BO96DRAFT_501832 [Aspergillus niger CBS 101883]
MSVNTSRNRNILEGLFKELLDMRDRVPEDGHISIARFRDIEHVTQFNFIELDSAEVNLALVPPVLFEPMDWASLKQHPVDPELAREFFDIDQDDECDFPMEPVDRVRQVSTLIEDRTTHEARSKQNLQTVQAPESTFLLEASLYRNYSYNSSWTARCLVEPCPDDVKVYPNLAFHVLGDKVSNEDSILYSELSAIVEAMKGRANQRRVDSERGREELDECDGRGKEAYPYLFSDEETQWDSAETIHKIQGKSLRAWPDLRSGSKVSIEQFLLSRVLCPPRRGPSQLVNGQFGITPALLTRAKNLLQMIPSYQLYLQNIGGNNWADPALGPFGPVLRLQAEIRAGWAKGGGKQTDEDTVNAAFIELLNALTSLVPTTDSWWRTTKRRLTFTGLRNGYVAITDGQFEVKATEEIRTPIECKGREREKLNARITMQEVAELVAWVKEYPDARISPPVRFRPLAGQCGQEIFLESLEYGQDWIKYIRQGQKAGNSFANLHSYGPYDMNKVSDMRLLAPVIVAMSY